MEVLVLIAFIFLLLFIYGLFSEKLDEWSVSGPMVFTIFGLIAGPFIDFDEYGLKHANIQVVGQIALIVILFTDASSISIKDFFKVYKWPLRLLFIGLPITMITGTLLAIPFFEGVEIAAIAMMAFILSPTDAALGQAVVMSKHVPEKIRETINVESGLNDGLVLPPIIVCVLILQGKSEQMDAAVLTLYISKQLLLAPLVGMIMGWLGTHLISWASLKNYMSHIYQGIGIVGLSILSYIIAEEIGGNGYIAAFVSGLFFNVKSKEIKETGIEFGEFLSLPLSLFVFFVFGAIIFPFYTPFMTLEVVLYALLSLTVIRILPVLLSLFKSGIPRYQRIFVSWFGPRGIASILYLLMVYNSLDEPERFNTLYAVIVLVIFLCIFLHGISAVPYSRWIGKKSKSN